MRLARIELRNYRCFESVDVELAETTVIVGANDTGKSAILEAIQGLLEPDQGDWVSAERGQGEPIQIVGHFVDLTEAESTPLAAFMTEGVLKIGLRSDYNLEHCLVVGARQAEFIRSRLDPDTLEATVGTGVTAESFGKVVDVSGSVEPEVWFPAWVWELDRSNEWGATLDGWSLRPDRLRLMRPIRLGTASDVTWDPTEVLAPIVARHVDGDLGTELLDAIQLVEDRFDDLAERLSRAHSAVLRQSPTYKWIRWHGESGLAEQLVENLVAEVFADPDGPAEWRAVEALPHGPDRRVQTQLALFRSPPPTLSNLGPGTQRSIALAALELYADPDLWPLGGSVVLLLDEPESGLHPEAQRRAAALIRGLARYGLQVVLVTHSPAFINAAPPDGIRLAHRSALPGGAVDRMVGQPVALSEIRTELGVLPADILLARRFVIVEGESDRAILEMWARKCGVAFAAAQIQLVPSGGHTSAERVAQFLSLAYEGADFVVILDNGPQTTKTKSEIEARFGHRVKVDLLTRTDIEGFFHPAAVIAWLHLRGVEGDDMEETVRARLLGSGGGRVGSLDALARKLLGRPYEKVTDGLAIAAATPEHLIDPEIVGLVTRLTQ